VRHEALLEGNINACDVLVIKFEEKMSLEETSGVWGRHY
jgi:hypothetical protein